MIGADDILDDAHWINVQDPIRKMFLSLTKAMRTQAAGIRDLDKKYNDLITHDSAERLVRDNVNNCCSKQDATQLIYQIDTKASGKDVAVLESKLEQAYRTIEVLTNKTQDQSLLINDLTQRIESMSHDIHSLKNPNYEQIFSYIDRQVNNLGNDVDRKLAVKADTAVVQSCIPQRLEDLYRSMNVKINEMKVDLARCATKEEFQVLVNNKANVNDMKELSHELKESVTRNELQQQVNNQVKPLVAALASVEKALQIQDVSAKHTQTTFTDKMQTLERLYREYIDHKASNDEQIQMALNRDKLNSVVEDIMLSKGLGEVTPVTVESALQHQTEYLLNKMGIMGESIRLEVVTSSREEFNSIHHQMDNKITEVNNMAKEISEKHMKTRKAVKELSLNVANALSKKVDMKDYKSQLKLQEQYQQLYSGHTSSSGGGSTIRRRGYESVVQQSRSLLNTSQDNNMLSSAAENDPNREFDYLLQSMRSERNRKSYHEGGENRNHRYQNVDGEVSEDETDSLEDSKKSTDHQHTSRLSHIRSFNRTTRSHSSSPLRRSRAHFQSDEFKASGGSAFGFGHFGNKSVLKNSRMSKQTEESVESLQKTVHSLSQEMEQLKLSITAHLTRSHSHNTFNATQAAANDIDKLDWRMALGEISMNLRKELSDKSSREELHSSIRSEIEGVDRKISAIQKQVDAAAVSTDLVKLETDFTILRNRVAGELTGARFLWTSGQVLTDGWLPWDVQVINVAPSIIVWKKSSTDILVKVPGLYHICVSVFTSLPTVLQIFLNDEPLFSFQPDVLNSGQNANPSSEKNEKYTLRRLRHSAGEVSSINISEFVSLPADANIMVRYHATSPAQAFFAIRKL